MNLPFAHLRARKDHLVAAGASTRLDPALLAAIIWRETNAGLLIEKTQGAGDWTARRGRYLSLPGVKVVAELPPGWHPPRDEEGQVLPGPYAIPEDELGWGRGDPQVDYASHLAWIRTHDWRNPAVSIPKGAEILARSIAICHGNTLAGIAAYNAGPKYPIRELERVGTSNEGALILALDRHTTGHDYVRFVVDHWRRFGAGGA